MVAIQYSTEARQIINNKVKNISPVLGKYALWMHMPGGQTIIRHHASLHTRL